MKRLLTAALALSLLGGTAAVAQPDHHDDHGGYGQQGDHNNNHGNDRSREVHAQNYDRHAQHNWARGQRLPATYYQDRGHYVDYRSHHLRRPPHGYQWVQADNNYALVALTTGLIASIVIANH
jgi:Ni/Co efflux regulator RcnB